MSIEEKQNILKKYQLNELNSKFERNLESEVAMLNRLMVFSMGLSHRKKLVFLSNHKSPKIDIEGLLENLATHDVDQLVSSWSGLVEYFTSMPITLPEQELLIQTAIQHGISLRIFAYDVISRNKTLNVLLENGNGFEYSGLNQFQRGIYEILAYGSACTNIKQRLVESYTLHTLYGQNNASVPRNQLIDAISNQSKIAKAEVETTLSSLLIKKAIEKDPANKKNIQIADLGRQKVLEAQAISKNEEAAFINDLEEICKQHNIRVPVDDVLAHLKKLGLDTYRGILNHQEPSEDGAINLCQYFESIYAINIPECMQKMRMLCQNNPFMSRMCIGELFVSNVNSQDIEAYTKNAKKVIYLDTPIIVYWLCYLAFKFPKSEDWENSRYQATRDLMDFIENNQEEIQLIIRFQYLKETAGEIQKALRLQILDKAHFDIRFSTNNTFYQYYQFVKEKRGYDSFSEFLSAIGISAREVDNIHFVTRTAQFLQGLLNKVWKNLQIDNYEHSNEQYGEVTKNLPEVYLQRRNVTPIKNDIGQVLQIQHALRKNGTVHSYYIATWDDIFCAIRDYLQKVDTHCIFYVSSPTQLASQLAMAHFTLSANILTDAMFITAESTDAIKRLYDNVLAKLLISSEEQSLDAMHNLLEAQKEYMQTNPLSIEQIEKDGYPLENVIDCICTNVRDWGLSMTYLRKYINDKEQFEQISKDLKAGYEEIKEQKNYEKGEAIILFKDHLSQWAKEHPEVDTLEEDEE